MFADCKVWPGGGTNILQGDDSYNYTGGWTETYSNGSLTSATRAGGNNASGSSSSYYLHNPGSYVTQSSSNYTTTLTVGGWGGSDYTGTGALGGPGYVAVTGCWSPEWRR